MHEDNTPSIQLQSTYAQYARVYHVTTRYRADLIAAKGIDPARSKGKLKVSWYVAAPMLAWAIAHVALRHGTPLENIVVIPVTMPHEKLTRTRWKNVLTCDTKAFPDPRLYISARRALRRIAGDKWTTWF